MFRPPNAAWACSEVVDLDHNRAFVASILTQLGCYAIGQVISDMPWKILSVIYNVPLYFMVHFQWRLGHFFIWFLSLYLAFQSISLMFRAIAVFTVAPDRAALPVGLWLNVLIIYSGFYIPIPEMKVWLGWLRFLDPMYYAYETMMINQFWDQSYSCASNSIAPHGPQFNDVGYQSCAIPGAEPGSLEVAGQSYLRTQYEFQEKHLWRNVGINAGFFVFFSLCVAYGMERFKPAAGKLATVFYKQGTLGDQQPPLKTDVESPEDKSEPQSMTDTDRSWSEKDPTPRDVTSALSRVKAEHAFVWKDLSLEIKTESQTKRLLNNVSAWTKPGLTALVS